MFRTNPECFNTARLIQAFGGKEARLHPSLFQRAGAHRAETLNSSCSHRHVRDSGPSGDFLERCHTSQVSPCNTWLPAEISAWTKGSCPQPQQGAPAACAPQPGGPCLVTQLRGHHRERARVDGAMDGVCQNEEGNCVRRGWGGRTCFHDRQTPQNRQKGDGCDPFGGSCPVTSWTTPKVTHCCS